jgi:DnaJ-class molecular chaperone
MMEDLYKILGVSRDDDAEALKRAYKELAKQYHPDRNPGNKQAEDRFKEVNNAYDILSDPQKKAAYDRENFQMGGRPFHGGMHTQAHYGTGPFTGSGFNTGNVDDLFADVFGPFARRHGGSQQRVYQNQHINLNYQMTLEEAFHGKETEVIYSFRGKLNQSLKLTIPPGIVDGMKIRFAGKGDDSLKGVPPGDLFVTIGIVAHPRFQRLEQLTLLASESVTYLDAILGCERELRTIDGTTISIDIPANISDGTLLKVSGKGMKDQLGRRGDLLVEVKLVPPKLTSKQRSILTAVQNEIKLTS